MPTLAVFGAGPALGLSTASRFARDGYRIELVGRTRATLDRLGTELARRGAEVAFTVADLAAPAQVREAAIEIQSRSGTPDVTLYSPGDVTRLPVEARSLDAATLQTWLPLNLLSPIELVHTILPGMRERGSGVLVFAQGSAVRHPIPAVASSSVAQAGLLNYIRALSADVKRDGVRLISFQIGQLIDRSAAAQLFDSGHFDGVDAGQLDRVDPDRLADQLWVLAHDAAAAPEYVS